MKNHMKENKSNTKAKSTKEHSHPSFNGTVTSLFLPQFSSKSLNSYKSLEPIELFTGYDPDYFPDVKASVVAETPEYYVYYYSRKSDYSSCLIRQSKNNPDDIVFLSSCSENNICLFHGKIFFTLQRHYFENLLGSVDIITGKRTLPDWFSHKCYEITAAMVSHEYVQDSVDSLHLDNGKLFVTVSRKKSDAKDDDPFDVTMTYTLCISIVKGKYFVVPSYTDIDTSRIETLPSVPYKKWRIATAKGLYFFIDSENRVAKTRNGAVLQTNYLELAEKMVDELERYGGDPPEITFLSLQMNMCDSFKQFPHKEAVDLLTTYFTNIDDWTYRIQHNDANMDKLFGHEEERTRTIESWLPKHTRMQMNVIFALGKKYKSLNLPYVLAMIIENTPPSVRQHSLHQLTSYINNYGCTIIAQDDIDVFALYYEIHFNKNGSTTSEEAKHIDFMALLNEGTPAPSRHQGFQKNNLRYCRFCGRSIPLDSIFCPACGKRLE